MLQQIENVDRFGERSGPEHFQFLDCLPLPAFGPLISGFSKIVSGDGARRLLLVPALSRRRSRGDPQALDPRLGPPGQNEDHLQACPQEGQSAVRQPA